MPNTRKKKVAYVCALIAVVILLPVIWFVTASADMAIERVAAGFSNGPIERFIIRASEDYSAPMFPLMRFTVLRRARNSQTRGAGKTPAAVA